MSADFKSSDYKSPVYRENVKQHELIDLSLYKRFGLRGPGAKSCLESNKLPFDIAPNTIISVDKDSVMMALSQTERWLLSTTDSNSNKKMDSVEQSVNATADCYSLSCQYSHAWFVLRSAQRESLMATLCGVDLREEHFPLGSVAQTSIAKINAIIAFHNFNDEGVFSILCDSSVAEYCWRTLVKTIDRFSVNNKS